MTVIFGFPEWYLTEFLYFTEYLDPKMPNIMVKLANGLHLSELPSWKPKIGHTLT